MKIIREPFKFLIQYRVPFLALMLYVVITYTLGIEGCPFELIFGVPCPSCGITRALTSAITFDFVNAFH